MAHCDDTEGAASGRRWGNATASIA